MTVPEAAPTVSRNARQRRAFRAPFHDAGPTGHVGVVPLANYLQHAAAEHAESLGVAAERLAGDGLFWVLTRLYMRIIRAPRGGETIDVETWPSRRPRQLFLRDFRIRSATGELLLAATSNWALIDATSRKAVRGPAWVAKLVAVDTERAAEFPGRSPAALETAEMSIGIVPRQSDLDLNGHVNNAHLAGWLLEVFDEAWFAGRDLAALDIAFRSECRRGDVVESRAAMIDPDHIRHTLRRGDGAEIARAETWWRPAA